MLSPARTTAGLRARLAAKEFHADLRAASRVLPPRPTANRRTLGLVRRMAPNGPVAGASQEQAGDVPVLVFRPPGQVRGAVLWIHGGGMVLGTPQLDAATCRRIAEEHDAVVVAPDYRLAPEHPFPVPLEDCYRALRWLARLPESANVPVVVSGASAGGGLAAGVALAARDRGGVTLAGQVLVYPMLDDRTAARPDPSPAVRRLWDNTANQFGWGSYLDQPPGSAGVSPYAAPARAEDLTGLPRTWIGVGSLDLFLEEDVEYAERLRSAGVPTELEVVPGAFHGFDALPKAPVSRAFVDTLVSAIGRVLAA
jgi:acetyl esterase/lipase